MVRLQYSSENPYAVLGDSGLPYIATERFGLNLLLERPVNRLGRYIVYVNEDDAKRWAEYLKSSGASKVRHAGNLIIHSSQDLNALSPSQVPPLEILVKDLRLKSPRYVTAKFHELCELIPGFREAILAQSSLESLNLSDTS